MVSKFELKRSAFLSFIGMLSLFIIAGAEWVAAEQYGILESGGPIFYIVVIFQLILIWLAFLLSLVFFGCIAEYSGREPGIITLILAYIPAVIYMASVGILGRFIYIFIAVSILAIIYLLYSE